ncbi:MAG: hypothetical protein PHC85_02240 [Candidatus Pacebacteria bacterium]|nr:hypothetical protein [Candidatus Paceibacterota bacterium]
MEIGSSQGPEKDLKVVLVFLLGLFLVWYALGGPKNIPFPKDLFVDKTPLDENYGSSSSEASGTNGVLASGDKISISVSGAREAKPQREYIEIKASSGNKNSIDITGWILVGKTGLDLKIPQAVNLVVAGSENYKTDVVLKPGEKAVINTGRSPIGYSFRVNKCSGYLSQANLFYPSVSKKCPYPKDEDWPAGLSDACRDFIKTISSCRVNVSVPVKLGDECASAISEKLNYNKCVSTHKNDENFYQSEWRVYMDREEELWKKTSERIILKDRNGNIVITSAY